MKEKNSETIDLNQLREEVDRASKVYYHTPLQLGIDNRTKTFVIEQCEKFICGPNVLELGYIDGFWTQRLVDSGFNVDVVEGAHEHAEHGKQSFAGNKKVRVFHKLFQEFVPDRTYDTIIAGDMIRYLEAPDKFLRAARSWLNPAGRVIVTVPNSRSLHRRIGSLMQIQKTPMSSNERDHEVGNQKSYDRYELRNLMLAAGYKIVELRGCFLKPLSSEQMSGFDDRLLRALFEIGNELEDYCWFLYAIGTAD